jgi:hypothetical protein
MKKLIFSVTVVAGFSMASFGQGVIYFDGSNNTSTSPSAASNGLVFINGVLDTASDINAELLYSSTATGTFSPVVTLLLSSLASPIGNNVGQTIAAAGDITSYGNGSLIDTSGNAYFTPLGSGTTGYFEVQGWLGNEISLAAAQAAGQPAGSSGVFSEVLTSATGTANSVNNMPALNLTAVPEPSTLAMAGVGLASMLIFRRRNK